MKENKALLVLDVIGEQIFGPVFMGKNVIKNVKVTLAFKEGYNLKEGVIDND